MTHAMTQRIRKAVFPVAGLGTRFLPATKSMPKEMLTVIDKPLIYYAVEEAKKSGIEEFIFVTGRGKEAIEDFFDYSYELNTILENRNNQSDLDAVNALVLDPGQVVYTRQQEPLGLGHAIWCARHLVGNEPFAVLLADDLIVSKQPCLQQMMTHYETVGGNMAAAMTVPKDATSGYGILDMDGPTKGPLVKAKNLVEKPSVETAPSTTAIIGRYILSPAIFDELDKKIKGTGGEIQITDALQRMIPTHPFHGYAFEGERFDCGNKAGFLKATIALSLERDDLKDVTLDFMKRITE
jgi:UTP--glucose-1-phosphate uridylyltransferase